MEVQFCGSTSSSRSDRKAIEKDRRIRMKELYSHLTILVPNLTHSKELRSLSDQLDEAAKYIKMTQQKLEKMKEKKDHLMEIEKISNKLHTGITMEGLIHNHPQIEVHNLGSTLQVVLVAGTNHSSMFYGIIRLLHEEGAEVVNASFAVVNNRTFHTINSEVDQSAVGYEFGRVSWRLKQFINQSVVNSLS